MKAAISNGFLRKTTIGLCLLLSLQASASAQSASEPDRSRLLNGLRVVLLPRPGDQDVLVKVRVHSGGAFDLAGKAGSMALLGDILFPDPTTREYFTDEMQGRLNVATDYDSITITLQGKAREFERIVEILRTALVTTQLTPENVAKIREGRIKVVRETSNSPAMLADRAIATRLFGDFPYGRPYAGSVESLDRVDRADLMLARERFLNPNNSTIVVIGGVQPGRALRTLRQLLGAWRKSEQIIPATFRQPLPPDPRTLIIDTPGGQSAEVRLAVRGLARQDADSTAAALLAGVARQRWLKLLPDLARSPVFVRHEAYVLPGIFVMGASMENLLAGKSLSTAQEVVKSFANTPVTANELEQARTELAQSNQGTTQATSLADSWLDMDTYGLTSEAEQNRLTSITPNDLQRVAMRLFREGSIASIVVGNSELVKTQLEQFGKVELMGELKPKTDPSVESKSNSNSAKPQTKAATKPE